MKLFLRYYLFLIPDTTSHHLRMKNNPLSFLTIRSLDEGRALVWLGRRRKPRDFASCADKDVDRSTTNSRVLTCGAAAFQTRVNSGGAELPVEADVFRVSETALGSTVYFAKPNISAHSFSHALISNQCTRQDFWMLCWDISRVLSLQKQAYS